MRKLALQMLAGSALALFLPLAAFAQTSGIAGDVKDTSGAVLPGVTVEVSSPALIERTRAATTDGAGRFSITNLRTGTYSVTFTLPGFNTVKRDDVELTSDFTATISTEMKVGAIEETITVAAESPLVDVQSITARTVMTRDVMDTIPTGRNIQAVGILIPGTSLAARRRRRVVARRRRFGQPSAIAAAVSRLERHGPNDRRHAPQQSVRAGRV